MFTLQFTLGETQCLLLYCQKCLCIGLLHIDLGLLDPDRLKPGFCLGNGQLIIAGIDPEQHLTLPDQCPLLKAWMQCDDLPAHLSHAAPHPAGFDIARRYQLGCNGDFRHTDHPHGSRLLGNNHPHGF